MTAAAPLLAVEGLSIRPDGVARNLVDDLSFTVAAGETLCIVGESGCGKSLTALALMGLLATPPLRVTAGAARFEGHDLLALPRAGLARIRGDRMAMIFQEPMSALNPAIRIGEQIAEAVRRHRGSGRAAARARALAMLRRVRIPAPERRLDEFAHQLSGGMRQRAMIAMALANDPALLIADEPTTALDVTIQAQILDLLRNLARDTGAVLTEQIFTIPGFGKLVVDAVFSRDYAVVQGIVLCTGVGFIAMNILADAAYRILNPRMRDA